MGLRILLASDFYPPFIGGAELQVQVLGRELVRRGHRVDVVTVWHEGLPREEDDHGVSVHRLEGLMTRVPWFSSDPKRRFHPPFPDPGIGWGVRRLVRQSHPDLVDASGWIAYSCAAALVGTGVPLILSVRDYGYSCAIRTLLHHDQVCGGPGPRKCLECATGRFGLSKALVAVGGVYSGRPLLTRTTAATRSVSNFVRDIVSRDFLSRGAHRRRSTNITIPDVVRSHPGNGPSAEDNADDTEGFLDQLPTTPYILFVGALQLHKGLGPLLAAYATLDSAPPLVLIGSVWPDTPASFPPGVVVMRDIPHPCVMAAWERCLFGVAPSVWPDPLPGVVREAMSKGKPVVGTRIGGIPDMVEDGETGLLVEPGDVAALASAMARLIAAPELRQRMGHAAGESALRYTAEAVLPRVEALYVEIAATQVTSAA
jgi:glycosyltransferase involved in cell wall biosynthesis